MYAIETAKLSSKGQMVIPDSFRIGIPLPVGMEDGDARRKALLEKHG